ncbi:hypothetical protein PG989_012914 [Apiospora arundinis]
MSYPPHPPVYHAPVCDTDTAIHVPTPYSVYDVQSETEPTSGRTYQNFKPGRYPFPNDDTEQERMDIQHHMFRIALGSKLYLAPINLQRTKYVLDVGTGTGAWANDFAEEHPQCQVIGIDLTTIQPSRVPNCTFRRADAEDEWVYYPRKFDFVYMRCMNVCFDNPQGVLRQAFLNMNPGATIEYQSSTWEICSDDGTAEGTNLERWLQLLTAGAKAMGRDALSCLRVEQWLKELGFVDVHRVEGLLPTSSWPREKRWNLVGKYMTEDLYMGLDGISRRLLTAAGLHTAQINEFLPLVRADIRNTNIHAYIPYQVVYAQKPSHQEMTR